MKDVVIVGGGLAGLSAAWRLRNRDTVLLESEPRIGGRIRSERRGPYWLNWGGHVFAGGSSATAQLLGETGVAPVPVPGSLSGLAMNGKLIVKGRVETYPFRIPMPMSARLGTVKAGAKVVLGVARYARIVRRRKGESADARQQRIYDFLNDRTFADYLGSLPPDAEALFTPTVARSSGDIDEVAAGAGLGYYSLVWNIGAGLSNNIAGGPSTLTETIAAVLGDRVRTGAAVAEVVQKPGSVVVRYRQDGVDQEVEARCAVLATPATVSHRVAVDLDADVREALSTVKYGPYVSAAFLTGETERRVWDDSYAIATPKRSFDVILNMSSVARGQETERRPGSSLMAFSPGRLARELLEQSDEQITKTFLQDLSDILPGFDGTVVESHVQRWPTGAPYCFPGRGKLQPTLTRGGGRVFLAGDYLGTLYTETAIQSALTAAQDAQRVLAADSQDRRSAARR